MMAFGAGDFAWIQNRAGRGSPRAADVYAFDVA